MDGSDVVTWVNMLTTVHDGTENVVRTRRRPRETSTSAMISRMPFGSNARKELAIPQVIDNYNYHMNKVDLSDQLRSYYGSQFRSCRSWWPLFVFLMDVICCNSFILS